MEEKVFKVEELEQFVHDHIQQKVDSAELGLTGVNLEDFNEFKRDMFIYENALLEGIINGIVMCNGKVEGIEVN